MLDGLNETGAEINETSAANRLLTFIEFALRFFQSAVGLVICVCLCRLLNASAPILSKCAQTKKRWTYVSC